MPKVLFRGVEYAAHQFRYPSGGQLGIMLVNEESETLKATVNFPDAPLPAQHTFVKNYSELTGMLAALVAAGVVEQVPELDAASGYVTLTAAKLSAPLPEY
jgi:hypothetical protein